jgi:energy-coupling factor transport system permease protein
LIFIVSHPLAAAAPALALIALWLAAKMPFKKIISYIKFLAIMVLFITLMQMLFGPGSRYIVQPLIPDSVPLIGGLGSLKWDGLILGLVSALRLLSLVLLLPLLTGTTSMNALAQGLAGLGLNYKAAFVITSAINLVPALEEEARHIIDAQKLRGFRVFDKGTLWSKLRVYPALAVPLIMSAMRRSQSMAYAMDSRAFGAYARRSWSEPLVMKKRDYAAIGISIAYCGIVLCAQFIL